MPSHSKAAVGHWTCPGETGHSTIQAMLRPDITDRMWPSPSLFDRSGTTPSPPSTHNRGQDLDSQPHFPTNQSQLTRNNNQLQPLSASFASFFFSLPDHFY
ncbi:hypothetical protein VTL71DRAFT_11253, partial [Oculimacula yallundae]